MPFIWLEKPHITNTHSQKYSDNKIKCHTCSSIAIFFSNLIFVTTFFTLYIFFHYIWVFRHDPLDLQPQINYTHDKQVVSRCMVCKTLWIIMSAKSNYLKRLSNQVAHLKIIFYFFHEYNGSKLGIHGHNIVSLNVIDFHNTQIAHLWI